MDYQMLRPQNVLHIMGLYSLHYFQFASGHVFSGEKHDFWEMVYLDQGEADIGAGTQVHRLRQGQVIFHKPNEFHSIWANYAKGPNIFVISFACVSPAMRFFRGRQFTLEPAQRKLLGRMIDEGQKTFGPVLDITDLKQLVPVKDAPNGGQQLIVLYLTQLLIELMRRRSETRPAPAQPHLTGEADFSNVFTEVSQYMRDHPDGSLRFPAVCRRAGLSKTAFKEKFRNYTGTTVMEYYRHIRIEEGRRRLREGKMNISQIAGDLGYSSLPAFSRQFRRLMGISPTEYLSMVRE